MAKKEKYIQFFKFCLVGAMNTVLDILIYGLLHQFLNFDIILSSTITVLIVITFSYLMNAYFVFKSKPRVKSYIEFFITTGIGIIIIQGIISRYTEPIMSSLLQLTPASSEAEIFISNSIVRIAGTIFSLVWNFLFYKYFVFRITTIVKNSSRENNLTIEDQ